MPLKSKAPAAPSLHFSLLSLIGAALAIGATGWLSQVSGALWLMAPFGASCVLAFGMPDSPLAQPRNIIGGHVIATLVGLAVLHTLGDSWWSAALAVGLALAAMQQTRTLHAPAGANPLVVIASHAPLSFVVTPVLAGSLVIVAVAWCLNNARQANSYPKYWY
ncbi:MULTISPECIES: HPP family protein [Pseudomonas]|uniref:HPP family protein n=1 Tax=Pseudomonas donghuensis TaxID=1163398 RepID=A0AAP0SJ19_9PSED|nr:MULTISPECIES: HPP family protein [Pseudomonas]MDF9895834.1 CBS-domain-containing membrane protein [Pseudomonas vranovensis]KDO00231.1 HPP family protein [Pseudomonas donghuensis]MCP6689956.1 HPP family protein [Pseudomonas donghuensis]QHF30750.1 HPP family protein [Pseudomonas sp. R32]UVL24062.1 HPP family protein [Pseudomonas donghuensis]